MALIHSANDPQTVYRNPSASITGIQRFCSGALFYGIDGWGQLPNYGKRVYKTYTAANTFKEYRDLWSNTPQNQLNEHGAYCLLLEKLYIKAKTGEGGRDMYASQTYATKTWFMADRERRGRGLHINGFMHWLKALGRNKVGTIYISPYRDGAHGGRCKGAVYAPDLPRVREFLFYELAKWNTHAHKVCELYFTPAEQDKAANEIGELW
jgi:hypothetical protein